ncbi:glycosyltransferase family 2 protein, partial [Candidatus Pacearchaeota archaeon]|nr:glycosyltransferase family 2 protein [Candidatus Pacearchaeota archaeon]
MQVITGIYFFYMFVSIYFLILVVTLYLQNRKDIFFSPQITRNYTLSVVIPAWNEEKTIASTIEHIFASDYKGLLEVLVVDDGSTDNTFKIAKSLTKRYKNLIVFTKSNSGKANSVNYALKHAKGELVSVIDADSFPEKSAFSKMIGYFDDLQVGAVTATCTPKNRNTLLEKLQTIEYKIIAFSRKLLEYIESIYVAPGSLSIYRKKALLAIGGFDPKNITEDIESTWHILSEGWKVRMCLSA